jgi:hypothetical protein
MTQITFGARQPASLHHQGCRSPVFTGGNFS